MRNDKILKLVNQYNSLTSMGGIMKTFFISILLIGIFYLVFFILVLPAQFRQVR